MSLILPRRRFLTVAGAGLAGATLPSLAAQAADAPAAARQPAEGAAPAAASFTFAHLTDTHVQPELAADVGLRQCIAKVNALEPRPDFVITGGDLIMDSLATTRERYTLEWKLFDGCLADLAVPVYHTIGNHDVVGWAKQSPIGRDEPDYGKRIFAERYGAGRTYRSFDHKGWHFILLDSIGQAADSPDYIGLVDQEQLAWLESDLKQTGAARPIVVVTHIPFFSAYPQAVAGPTKAVSPGSLITNVAELWKLLGPYNVQLVLSGHGHVRERIELGGTTYIQSGAVSGRWWKGHVMGEEEAFGLVTCRPDGFDYRYVDYGWEARAV